MADDQVTPVNEPTPAPASDNWSRRIIIGGLLLTLLIMVGGWMTLSFMAKEPPENVITIVVSIITGLFGILNPARGK